MKKVYFWSLKLKKRDILLAILAITILSASIICRVGAYEGTVASAVSWKIANRVVVIDPGHGGYDPGAVGKNGTLEKEVVLQVAHKLKKLFSDAGAVVILTRETDTELGNLKKQDLAARVALANKHKADIYISLHLNSYPSSRWSGAQTFYHPGQLDSKLLAELIQTEFKRQLKNTNRQVLAEEFYTSRFTRMNTVTVEMGFVSNPREEQLLVREDYQDKLAKAIYSGAAKYLAEDKTAKKEKLAKDRKKEVK